MNKNLYEWVKHSDLYNTFTLLDDEVAFNEFFKDENYDCVQVYATQLYPIVPDYDTKKFIYGEWDMVGFAGQFKWENNKLTSLDGDSYSKEMTVYGYEKFTNEEESVFNGLNVLIGDDW